MFSLHFFGGASLHAEGEPLSGPVAQRRRLALLALLAVPTGRTITRDKLIAYLWPNVGGERARHLLSESLYVIRKALGEEAVLAAGDELRLNPQLISSDVAEFEAAVAGSDLERAVALYGGPFLDGIFLDDNAEYERWAEGERARLAREFEKALEGLAAARRVAGDLVGAADAWRRAAREDPYNARVALCLMQALDAAGDRAGALQAARVHELLLKEEFGAEPDPEVTAYAERLRTEPLPREPSVAAAPADAPESPPVRGAPSPAPDGGQAPEPAAEAPSSAVGLPAGVEAPRPSRRGRQVLAYAAALLLVAILGFGALRTEVGQSYAPQALVRLASPSDDRSIAVLPCVDLSPQRDHEWFSDGLAEEVINLLAQLEGVRVAARTSAFAFKGKDLDVREIGRRLGVRRVLECSVRTSENGMRVTAQLVSVRDGYHLWSETYARELEDVFSVQDDIARSVLSALRLRLAGGQAQLRPRQPTADLEAYNLYQQGRYFWNKRSPEGLARGMELFQRSLERDTTFALAYAGLADSYALLVTFGALAPHEGYPQARAAAQRALALDSTLAEAHASLALVRLYYEHDWRGAEASFRRALDLSPGYSTARQWYAHYLACRGQTAAALMEIRRAQELDPLSVAIHTAAGTVLYYAARHEEAATQYQRALEMEPHFWPAQMQLGAALLQTGDHAEAINRIEEAQRLAGGHPLPTGLLGYAYARAGRREEARAILAMLAEQGQRHYLSPAYLAAIHVGLGEHDAALAWLERGFDARDDWTVYLRAEPVFRPLHTDARFVQLLGRIGP